MKNNSGKQFICKKVGNNLVCSSVDQPAVQSHSPKTTTPKTQACKKTKLEADYVVIGGGTAGLTLAYLLKKSGHDVVVIEAGRDASADSAIKNHGTLNSLEVNKRNEYFWVGDAHPLPPTVSTATNVHANHYSGGRILGGTSAVNDGIWWRGQDSSYAAAGGLFADFNYLDNMFKSLESYSGPVNTPGDRGTSGPVDIVAGPTLGGVLQTSTTSLKFSQAVTQTYSTYYATTIPNVLDLNLTQGPCTSSIGQHTGNPVTLERESSATAFLTTPVGLSLDIRTNAQVLQINFKINELGESVAKSVSYLQEGQVVKMCARRKIILSAGHNSPAILMHSGIGDQSILQPLGIDVIYHNPQVGKNMKNHAAVQFLLRANPADTAQIFTYPNLFKNICGVASLPETGNPNSNNGRDYQVALVAAAPGVVAALLILVNAQSTGTVSIVAKDPLVPPVVDLNYLSDSRDRQSFLNGITMIDRMAQAMNAIDPAYGMLSNISNPNAFITANLSAFHHWHGQCRVGDVVDQNLDVIGVKGLMVADLTIFPLTDGNTQAMGYAAGAAAYTLLTGDYNVAF